MAGNNTLSNSVPRFEFVDVNSSNARKQARVHVMREFMRQKREDQMMPGGSTEDNPTANSKKSRRKKRGAQKDLALDSEKVVKKSPSQSPTTSPAPAGPQRPGQSFDEQRSTENESTDTDSSDLNRQAGELIQRTSEEMQRSRSTSPQRYLDSNKRDPFEAFPMRLDEEDIPLVDHYITIVPELMCNFKGMRLKSGTTSFNPTRDIILPQAMNNPIAFQATALAFAAGHLARLHGRTHSPQSMKHRVQTLRKLREHFFGQKQHSDDLDIVVAMLSLASCEDRFGDITAAWIHMRACIVMLEKLVGKLDFMRDRRLYTYMNWILITMTGYDSCALHPMTFKHPSSSPSSLLTPTSLAASTLSSSPLRSEAVEDTLSAVSSFIAFLRRIHVAARAAAHALLPQHHSTTSPIGAAPRRSRRIEAFLLNSPIYNLLSSAPGARPGVRSSHIQRACRFASALVLNAILLELSTRPPPSSPEDSLANLTQPPESATGRNLEDNPVEQYLKRLSIRIIEQELDWNLSAETLMWILLFGEEESEAQYGHSGLVWWAGRMVNVAKRLSEGMWSEVGAWMVECLTLEGWDKWDKREADVEGEVETWLERVRSELVRAPLSSHLGGQ